MGVNYHYNDLTHGAMQNLTTGDFIQFLLNPEQLQTGIQVNYARKNTVGGSHQWLQYTHTNNAQFTLDLLFSRFVFLELLRGDRTFNANEYASFQNEFEDYRRFLLELCYPRGNANDPLRKSPPTALLMWPRHVAMVVVLRSLQLTDSKFDTDQRVVEYKASCQFEEYRQYRLTSQEARRVGFVRAKAMTRGA